MSKLDDIIEIIGAVIHETSIDDVDKIVVKDITTLLAVLPDTYILVEWPESQELMEEEWFDDEAVLDVDCKFGDSAYFVPLKRVLK